MKKFIPFLIFSAVLVSSCGAPLYTRESQYPKMYEQKPVTLLIMPPINNTANVDAKDLLYSSISRPLAEAGYYVISPLLSMDILKAESAYDAELFVDKPLNMFHDYFGADAVVFSQIDKWVKVGVGIETKIRYFIKSTTTGDILFDRTCDLFLDLSVSHNGNSWLDLLADVAVTALSTATTDHIVAARKANYFIFKDIPRGKYSPLYLQDMEESADEKDIKTTIEG